MLLHYVGEEVGDIINTLTLPAATDEINVYHMTVNTLKAYFEPTKCIDHYVYFFWKETQKPDKSIADFYTHLKLTAKKCEFGDVNMEIKRQLIQGILLLDSGGRPLGKH